MKDKRILNFLINHFTIIQTTICCVYLVLWKIIINIFFNDFVQKTNYTVDLTFVFLELIYILIMLEGIFYTKSEDKRLRKRSLTTIEDYLKSAKHDFYVSGIINNSVINTFVNNYELLKECANRRVKIHILFYIADDETNFNWYRKMEHDYGNNSSSIQNSLKSDKEMYGTELSYIKSHKTFELLRKENLLEIKRLNYPITTAFVAKDIELRNEGQIQCLFYQFATYSPDCPIYVIKSNEEMYSFFRDILLHMWETANDKLEVSYIRSNQ